MKFKALLLAVILPPSVLLAQAGSQDLHLYFSSNGSCTKADIFI